jgi:hypothetical protein
MPDQKTSSTPDAQRRRWLRSVPAAAGVLALQACGGGSGETASAAQGAVSSPGTGTGTGAVSTVTSWAARPAASSASGQAILVTDVGVSGSVWISNGATWLPLATPMTLFHRFSNAQMDGSLGAGVDAYLDSCTIPAYLLQPASGLRVVAAYSFPGSGIGGKAPQIKAWFGAGTYASGFTGLLDARGQLTTQRSVLVDVRVQNKNSLAANQLRPYDYGSGASINAFADAAIDFSQAVTIGFGALNDSSSASAADQQRLEWFSVELVA